MRMTQQDTEKRTETFQFVQNNITPYPTCNVTLTLTLLQRPGGEMYGM